MSVENKGLAEHISFLPIDKNANGSIDYFENIYSDLTTFQRGVWIGKYPKSLSDNIYAVSNQQPADKAGQAFLSWIITSGQQYMNSYGFCELVNSESQSQLEKINTATLILPASANAGSKATMTLLFLACVIILAFVITFFVRFSLDKKAAVKTKTERLQPQAGFDRNSVLVPNGLFFDKTHTWAFMEKDGIVTIGLDDFIQHITGPITRIEMKNPGEKIKKGDLLISIIQSGKQLNMYAPVSGIIQKNNESLPGKSSELNTSPYSEGWVYKIEPSNWLKEIQLLEMADQYKKWLNTEFSRVKDFLAVTLKPDSPEYAHVVLQDGGVIKEGVLSDFGPEIWEEFQTTFLDVNK
jgi:glycine cleavage system H lipoate-binding protein